MSRYTVLGDDTLDQFIDAQLAGIRDRVVAEVGAAHIGALVLGGGYGRGEGGMRQTAEGQRPYNDYDLVLFHRHPRPQELQAPLDALHHEESRRCGIHVDVTPIPCARIPHLPPALTWYELGAGHVLLAGDAVVMEPLRRRTLAGVHPSEWGRLLVNRASGVAMAWRKLAGDPVQTGADEDTAAFAQRQAMKAWLALGDCLLADAGLYQPLVQRRRTKTPPQPPEWWPRWLAAADFKFAPTPAPALPDLRADLGRLRGLLAPALAARPAATFRPLVALANTARSLPPRCWWPPLRHPRDRLRLALVAELSGDAAGRDRHLGSWAGLEQVWNRFG